MGESEEDWQKSVIEADWRTFAEACERRPSVRALAKVRIAERINVRQYGRTNG